jgi:hypothetical protein
VKVPWATRHDCPKSRRLDAGRSTPVCCQLTNRTCSSEGAAPIPSGPAPMLVRRPRATSVLTNLVHTALAVRLLNGRIAEG